jgi:flavodoxin
MKTLVTYLSQTGNTEIIAKIIYNEIEDEKSISPLEDIKNIDDFDFIFFGFPIHEFGPAKKAAAFMNQHLSGKNVALFATHAMHPDAPVYGQQIENCLNKARHSNIKGFFSCRGELSESAANALLESSNPQLQMFGKMRPMTIGFPNADDIGKAKLFCRNMLATTRTF